MSRANFRAAGSGLGTLPAMSGDGQAIRDDVQSPGPRSGVLVVDRAVAILNTFTRDRPEIGMSEISRMTGLTTSTTHRLLAGLQAHDLVRQVADRRYALGPHVLRLAHVANARISLTEAALPVMRWLRDESGETVGLHVLQADHLRIVVDQVESREALRRTYTGLGEPIPLHQGAPGKVLLAYLSRDAREAILARPLEAATASTIIDADVLRAEVQDIRRRGYAFSFEERVPGIRTVAVPVWDHTGTVIACISVTGPATRLTKARLSELAPLAVQGGRELSAQLGFVDT